MTETVLVKVDSENQQIITAEGVALLFGVTADEVRTHSAGPTAETNDMSGYPPEWIQAGQRRAREAAAAIGENDLTRVLCYWANQESSAAEILVVVRQAD